MRFYFVHRDPFARNGRWTSKTEEKLRFNLSNFKSNALWGGTVLKNDGTVKGTLGTVVRYGGYSGYGTVGTVGTVRWVFGGYGTVGTVGAYLYHRTVPTVPNVPHPSPYHHF